MHIAVVLRDRCQFKKCSQECYHYCPLVRSGVKVVEFGEDGYPIISEELCEGCGICVHKCPFKAIKIINLPEELGEGLIHKYGKNGFRLYRLPSIPRNKVIGLIGPNGIGKTTAIKIMSGNLIPNFGEEKSSWDKVIERFSGTEYESYFSALRDGEIKVALKPQYVDMIPRIYRGKAIDLLKKVCEDTERIREISAHLGMDGFMNRDLSNLSGGELQILTIAAAILTDSDVLFFDEPSSYLDIKQRLKIAQFLKKLSRERKVYVVEHDLALLDFIADTVHILYGSAGAYGIISHPKSVRNGVNEYIAGFLRDENVRIRNWKIEFSVSAPKRRIGTSVICQWNPFRKKLGDFVLNAEGGEVYLGEVVGIVGPNAIGKTTFMKILAGVLEPDDGSVVMPAKISYKPQYIRIDYDGTVEDLLVETLKEKLTDAFTKNEIIKPLGVDSIYNKEVNNLSGGELQTLAIAVCLAREADIYLLDEPSAYLDSNQRMAVAKTILRVMEKSGSAAMIVDHDVYFIDAISSALIVFRGKPSEYGDATSPMNMHEGMNLFLRDIGITFRREPTTKRPRINDPDSYLDRKQKEMGEYYYVVGAE